MFWVAALPALVKEESPIVFSRSLGGGGGGGMPRKGLTVPGVKLSRSISQVSNFSRPSSSNLRRSLSIVSNYSMRVSPTLGSSLRRNKRLQSSNPVVTSCSCSCSLCCEISECHPECSNLAVFSSVVTNLTSPPNFITIIKFSSSLFCRSIIPRSLSSTFQTGSPMISSMSSDSVVDLSFRPSLRTDLMCHQSERRKETRGAGGLAGVVEPYDLTTIFLHKVGSCFNQLHSPVTATVGSSRQGPALQISITGGL